MGDCRFWAKSSRKSRRTSSCTSVSPIASDDRSQEGFDAFVHSNLAFLSAGLTYAPIQSFRRSVGNLRRSSPPSAGQLSAGLILKIEIAERLPGGSFTMKHASLCSSMIQGGEAARWHE